MIIRTLFDTEGRHQMGEVEVRLMPGVPQLLVVGMPDTHIRELGLKLKTAIKHSGLKWPRGHQVIVNLRPSYFRKSGAGVDLAIALGFLAATGQLEEEVRARLENCVVFGEVTLDGLICAPPGMVPALALAASAGVPLLTGPVMAQVREGEWYEVESLGGLGFLQRRSRVFDWNHFWQRPELPAISVHESAAKALWITAHAGLSVLVAGPQGSGKTTWAQLAHAMTPVPDKTVLLQTMSMFGESVMDETWRPFERPHHSIPALSMIGGGIPLQPGVISRANGGVLVMDEFLEFDPRVLEGLREPVESGVVEHVRRGDKAKFPARFQLIGTTNLCPCGKLSPGVDRTCGFNLLRCRSVAGRISGPVMDRFEWLIFSTGWLGAGAQVPVGDVRATVDRLRAFEAARGPQKGEELPDWIEVFGYSHRRRRAMLRVARALSDFDESIKIKPEHFHAAQDLVVTPMEQVRQLFG